MIDREVMNYDFRVMTPANACQFAALSAAFMLRSAGGIAKEAAVTSAKVIAEANITEQASA